MSAVQFFPASAVGWVNTRPNSPVQFTDINVNNILYAFKTTFTNESGTVVPVFQVGVLEGGSTAVGLTTSIYCFPTYGCTLAQFKTILNAQTPGVATVGTAVVQSNNLVSYTNLFAIDHKENTITKRDVLVNDDKVVRRIYTPKGDFTILYLNALQKTGSYLSFFLESDKTKAFAYYYAY